MKIPDSLLTHHLNVQPDQIEYTVKDKTTRVYFPVKLSGHFDKSEIVIEFDKYNAHVFLHTKGDGYTSSTTPIKMLLAQTYTQGEATPIGLVLEVKEQLRRLSEMISSIYVDTEDAPGIVKAVSKAEPLRDSDISFD